MFLPRNEKGQFISKRCIKPDCYGELELETHRMGDIFLWRRWICNGLVDPGHVDQPLEECGYSVEEVGNPIPPFMASA